MDSKVDNADTAFPASEATPGQAESRSAFQRFEDVRDVCPWWEEYLMLRAEGWTWRLAALIAWLASPADKRWPESQQELAVQVLGVRSDRIIRKWRQKRPEIDDRVGKLQVEPLFAHRRDVIEALVHVAKMHDPKAFQDRRLFLEMTGDYKPRQGMEHSGPDGGPIVFKEDLSDDELAEIAGL